MNSPRKVYVRVCVIWVGECVCVLVRAHAGRKTLPTRSIQTVSPGVVDVMTKRGGEETQLVQWSQQRVYLSGVDDLEHNLGDACGVREVVERVGVVSLTYRGDKVTQLLFRYLRRHGNERGGKAWLRALHTRKVFSRAVLDP